MSKTYGYPGIKMRYYYGDTAVEAEICIDRRPDRNNQAELPRQRLFIVYSLFDHSAIKDLK